jgi:assimilatory nitrate reductase electron transfer subunit
VPADPLALLLPDREDQDGSPALMPAATNVCRCNGVTKADIVHAWEEGAGSVRDVAAATRATTGCGGCRGVVCGLVDWLESVDPGSTTRTPEISEISQSPSPPGEESVAVAQHTDLRDEISAP